MTRRDNSRKSLLGKVGSKNNAAKLTQNQAIELLELKEEGFSYSVLAKKFNFGKSTVGSIVKGKT